MATVVCRRKMYRGVMQAVFNGNGGLRGAGAWRLHGKFWEFLGIFERGMGAPLYTPWVCLPVGGGARRADVPQGKTKQNKTNSAARLVKSQPPRPRVSL